MLKYPNIRESDFVVLIRKFVAMFYIGSCKASMSKIQEAANWFANYILLSSGFHIDICYKRKK